MKRHPATKEHLLLIPMPWKTLQYDICRDETRRARREFLISWFIQAGTLQLRMGFTMPKA